MLLVSAPKNQDEITFRHLTPEDKPRLLEIASGIWEGHDYLPHVFDRWVGEPDSYFAGIFLHGRLAGCGRLFHLDRGRAWLEALRVDPKLQGRGLGRQIAEHVVRRGLEMGYEELLFSTYFGNEISIKVSEQAGFRKIATFTNLEIELSKADTAATDPAVRIREGTAPTEGVVSNDWLLLPADLEDRSPYLPNPLVISDAECTLLLADNVKYGSRAQEICWVGGRASIDSLRTAIARAQREGREYMHTMLPAAMDLTPWIECGFSFFERKHDVYLYRARASEIRLPPPA